MKKPLLGFLFAMACAAAGFLWGRHKKAEALRLEEAARALPAPPPTPVAPEPDAPPPAARYIPWATLLRRVFGATAKPLVCPMCGGPMKSRVAPGGYPPGAPTDPDVRN